MSERTAVYFISDMHLGANYLVDKRTSEMRVVRFLEWIESDAATLYLLGDVLDYWFEYRTVVPRGHVRFLGALARLADAGVKIYWMTGNHDVWLRDYLSNEIGLTVLHKWTVHDIMGHKFLLSHGDDVCREPFMYRFMRFCFDSKVCQILYAAIHPRWTHAVAKGWSSNNRTRRQRSSKVMERANHRVNESVEQHLEFATKYSAEHTDVACYLFGHLHTVRLLKNAQNVPVVFAGDWIWHFTYVRFDGSKLTLNKFDSDKMTGEEIANVILP